MDDVERCNEALHNIRTGIRYHYRRQDFFERWHRLTGILSMVLSSAAIVAFFQESGAAAYAAAIIAITQAMDLMCETQKNAELHRGLRQRYMLIEPDVVSADALNPQQYRKIKQRLASIEVDEPPPRKVVLWIAQNEAGIASGFDPKAPGADWHTKVGRFRSFLANIWF